MKRLIYPFIAAALFASPLAADTFSDLDTNRDGVLSRPEFSRHSDLSGGRIGSSVRDEVEPRARFGEEGSDIGSSESWHEDSSSSMSVGPELEDSYDLKQEGAIGAEIPTGSSSSATGLDNL